MIEAACQRAAVPKTRSSNAWLPVAVLAALAASAHAQPQFRGSGVTAQAEQATTPAQTRGVPAQAATAAAASQDAPPPAPTPLSEGAPAKDPLANVQAAKPTEAAADAPALAAASALPRPAGTMRGVMFRITPPDAVLLPGQSMQQAQPAMAEATGAQQLDSTSPHIAEGVTTKLAPVRSSYLLATIHFGTPAEHGLDYAVLEHKLAEVETFVNEADLNSPWQSELDGYRWLPQEQPLSRMIGKDSFSKARSLLPNVRPQDLERMKPWSVLALLEARGEASSDATMDARLQRAAMAAGKRMAHLETLKQQLQALDCVPASEHSRVLDERLRASWILRIESAQAMAWYRARNLDGWLADIDRMEGLSEEARAIEQRARRCLLEDRNARWIGQLETLIQDGPCLIAVGAVHLVGPDGLLAALRRDGYRVEAEPL